MWNMLNLCKLQRPVVAPSQHDTKFSSFCWADCSVCKQILPFFNTAGLWKAFQQVAYCHAEMKFHHHIQIQMLQVSIWHWTILPSFWQWLGDLLNIYYKGGKIIFGRPVEMIIFIWVILLHFLQLQILRGLARNYKILSFLWQYFLHKKTDALI